MADSSDSSSEDDPFSHISGIASLNMSERTFDNLVSIYSQLNSNPEDLNLHGINPSNEMDGVGQGYGYVFMGDDIPFGTNEEFVGDISNDDDRSNSEDLVLDPLTFIARKEFLPHLKLPPKQFSPVKLTENEVIILPVLFTKKTVLPSDLLSLSYDIAPEYTNFIRHALNETNGIFVISQKFKKNTTILGSTAEMYKTNDSMVFPCYSVAHQMCEILSVEPFPNVSNTTLIGMAQINILPENTCYPYHKLGTNRRNRYSRGDKAIGDRCMQTPWSSWVYKQFDSVNLACQLEAKVQLLYHGLKLIFRDPYLISFDVLNLNIFTEDQRNYLRAMDSTIQRIHYEIQSLDNLICLRCSAVVTSMENIFSMPHESRVFFCERFYKLQTMDMITTTELNVEIDIKTELTSLYCLYSVYKWQKISCKSCSQQLGFRYVTEQNSSTTPKIFFGLKRSVLKSSKHYLPKQVQQNNNTLGNNELTEFWSLVRN